jgi:ATP-binding cassette subfamily B protein
LTILLRLLGFLRPYAGKVAITALAAAGVMACAVTLPYLTGRVIDDVLGAGDRDALAPLIGALVLLAVVRMGFAMLRRWVSGQVSLAVEYDLRARLFAHLGRMSFAYFDRMPVGQLMSRATSDLQTVRFFLGYGLIFFFMQAFTLLIITAILLVMDWSLALLALLMGPALLAVAWRYSRRSNPVLIDVQQRVGEVTEMAEESAVGIRVIKAFGRESDRTERFGATARRAFDRSMDAAHLRALYQPLMGFLPVLGLGVVLVYGGIQTIDGAMTLGEFVAFYLYLTMLMVPFRSLGMLIGQAQRAVAGGTRIFEVLDTEADVRDAPGATPMPPGDGGVRFAGVSFAYDPDGPAVLDGIDLDIPAGRSVAIIGPTGSGKTSLTQLIPRYYDATAGSVLVDGADVRGVRLDALRREVGVVSQDPFLFSTSVRENIAYGRPEATD